MRREGRGWSKSHKTAYGWASRFSPLLFPFDTAPCGRIPVILFPSAWSFVLRTKAGFNTNIMHRVDLPKTLTGGQAAPSRKWSGQGKCAVLLPFAHRFSDEPGMGSEPV